jgi:hypothetical protein
VDRPVYVDRPVVLNNEKVCVETTEVVAERPAVCTETTVKSESACGSTEEKTTTTTTETHGPVVTTSEFRPSLEFFRVHPRVYRSHSRVCLH